MIKTGNELAEAARNVAENYKSLYVLGCIGAPLNGANRVRYARNLAYNKRADRKKKIREASADTFGFDCVCLIKSLLWGWEGDTGKVYGGAAYASNGVPDIDANEMIRRCREVSADFTEVCVGEALWMEDHIGIYLGEGLAAECTARWKDGVQITAVYNLGVKPGYMGRSWEKHGKLPWVSYETAAEPAPTPAAGITGLPVIRYGSRGESARALQILLTGRGYDCGRSGADGIVGAATASAMKQYQTDHALQPDGIAGPATWAALLL